jgi:hypothetical protein
LSIVFLNKFSAPFSFSYHFEYLNLINIFIMIIMNFLSDKLYIFVSFGTVSEALSFFPYKEFPISLFFMTLCVGTMTNAVTYPILQVFISCNRNLSPIISARFSGDISKLPSRQKSLLCSHWPPNS